MHIGVRSETLKKEGWIIAVINPKGVPRPVLIVYHKDAETNQDEFYGIDAVCAHYGCGVLTRVETNQLTATCPLHGAKYDVRTGERLVEPSSLPTSPCGFCPANLPLKTYNVKDDDGWIDIKIDV